MHGLVSASIHAYPVATRKLLVRWCLLASAAIGTVEFTGFEMMATKAFGHARAMPSQRVFTMPAFILNRSSRVMPGLRGTPEVHQSERRGMRRSRQQVTHHALPQALCSSVYTCMPAPASGASNLVTCRNEYQLAALQACIQLLLANIAFDLSSRANVRQIRCNTRCVGNVIQAQLPNQGAALEQQRQRLADATGGAQHCHLRLRTRGQPTGGAYDTRVCSLKGGVTEQGTHASAKTKSCPTAHAYVVMAILTRRAAHAHLRAGAGAGLRHDVRGDALHPVHWDEEVADSANTSRVSGRKQSADCVSVKAAQGLMEWPASSASELRE
eukprot:189838-Chlamydomonas_euryale.AAC.10